MLLLKDQHRLHCHTVLERIIASVEMTGPMQIMDASENGAVIIVAALRVRGKERIQQLVMEVWPFSNLRILVSLLMIT